MGADDKVNILLVDDHPAKLLSYEVILAELGENIIKASSAREALAELLKRDVAVVLVDVVMPELDGFQLAAMIREHPRFQKTAIIFISAIQVEEVDRLRGYEIGAVDYVPVPVVPAVLKAKVRVFVELYRKTRQLEELNSELERRVAERTAELEASTARLQQSEQRRSLALAAGRMGSWDWDLTTGQCRWDEGQCSIFGVDPETFAPTADSVRPLVHPEDWDRLAEIGERALAACESCRAEFRIVRPSGEIRWCIGTAAVTAEAGGRAARMSGVTLDISDRKEAEERQVLLAREVDHRARNALALVQSILRLSRGDSAEAFVDSVSGRITALARAHTLLSQSRWRSADLRSLVDEELAPFRTADPKRIVAEGPSILLRPSTAQAIALALHELATNAAKYGALSAEEGRLSVSWRLEPEGLSLRWSETGGPPVRQPRAVGFGTRMIGATVERELGGDVSFEWRSSGLVCVVAVPRAQLAEPAPHGGQTDGDQALLEWPSPAEQAGDRRILLVEDEQLIAMMMHDLLVALGCTVVGPCGDLRSALAAAESASLVGAVLDVNVQGQLIDPVADVLVRRGLPFLFVTGYDADGVRRRYPGAPVLQKPVSQEMLECALAEALPPGGAGLTPPSSAISTAGSSAR